jgi:hypothetical protein
MAFDLRPLTLGELLDRAFSLYRRNFWLFVGIMALPSVIALGFGLIVAVFSPQPVNPESIAAGQTQPAEILGATVWFVAAIVGMFIVYFIAYAVALGATTVAVSELYMGQAITIRGAYAPLRGKVGRLALLLLLLAVRAFGVLFIGFGVVGFSVAMGAAGSPILAGLVMLAGMAGVFALWVWVILRYTVCVPAAVLEDK